MARTMPRCEPILGVLLAACVPYEVASSDADSSETTASNDATGTAGPSTTTTVDATSESTHASTESTESSSTGTSEEATASSGGSTDTGAAEGEPCTELIARTHTGPVRAFLDGDRSVTWDTAGNLVLWDAVTLDVLFEAGSVDEVFLAGGTLLYVSDGGAHTLAAATGAPIAQIAGGTRRGLALDGTYVWVSADDELRVHELDGTVRWSMNVATPISQALALGDQLHVYGSAESTSEVMHFDVDDGAVESDAFVGTFGGWFGDAPRFWTREGVTYRVYGTDNSLLAVGTGTPDHGWGDRLVVDDTVVDIAAPDIALVALEIPRLAGPAILSRAADDSATIVRLDTDPIGIEPVEITRWPSDEGFAWSDGGWLMGTIDGLVIDHLARSLTEGEVTGLAGAASGRLVLSLSNALAEVVDVGNDCSWNVISTFERDGGRLHMSGDGSVLLSIERWSPHPLMQVRSGTRGYALPEGDVILAISAGLSSDFVQSHDTSYDGALWSRLWGSAIGGQCEVRDSWNLVDFRYCSAVTRISPDGNHFATSYRPGHILHSWALSEVSIHGPDGLVATIDGVPHGFVDNDRVLVARYGDSAGTQFLDAELLATNGASVATTTLPDIRSLTIVAEGEVAGVDRYGNAAIYDIDAEAMIWQAPLGAQIAPAGPNHVLVSTGARVDLVRWR